MVKLATARECRAYGLGGGGRAARGGGSTSTPGRTSSRRCS
ncbi:hypothetical protein EE612_010190 [Oryza sativa]|nr:hypothetical protein EE612_010190 [Oryza sativa]